MRRLLGFTFFVLEGLSIICKRVLVGLEIRLAPVQSRQLVYMLHHAQQASLMPEACNDHSMGTIAGSVTQLWYWLANLG